MVTVQIFQKTYVLQAGDMRINRLLTYTRQDIHFDKNILKLYKNN